MRHVILVSHYVIQAEPRCFFVVPILGSIELDGLGNLDSLGHAQPANEFAPPRRLR